MNTRFYAVALVLSLVPVGTSAQMRMGDGHMGGESSSMRMLDIEFAGGWLLRGMGQVFPTWTTARTDGDTNFDDSEFRLTQPVGMFDLISPGGRFSFRFSPNLEGVTQEDGEITPGGWGEGFIDRRHPHTFVHEAMLSVNFPTASGGVSISGGKGFAPFGTEDPMSRPVLKYPTNHHLSQILERFTLNATVLSGAWSVEAGVFGGSEPEDAWDLSNYESFGDSWSVRLTRRFGPETRMGAWATEVSGSFASVTHGEHEDEGHGGGADHGDEHGAEESHPTRLLNGAVRMDRPWGDAHLYALIEASRNWEEEMDDGFWSILAEARVDAGRHVPYARIEWATRPEYPRLATSGSDFFRYDHDADPVAATRWTIATLGYGFTATRGAVSIRPFVEAQWAEIGSSRGAFDPTTEFGTDRITTLSIGARIFLGGDPMRMGTYGVLDPMTRPMADGMHGAMSGM